MNHEKLVELDGQGKILIGIDRVTARQFYTGVSIKKIKQETGESPYFEKTIVFGAFLLGPISLLATIILGFRFFNWWGIACLIFCPLIYFVYYGLSVRGNSKMIGISILLLISVCTYSLNFFGVPKITGFVTVFILSLWCARFLYCSSTVLLRNFVIRNEKAYQYLSQHLEIKSI